MIKPIIPSCVPVLPTVYSDSLSYYEEVCQLSEKINEIVRDINDNLSSYIDKNLNDIMVNAIYDEDTETIILSKELVTSSETHTYDASTNTLKVG